ncbi:MAG: hypothetical protein NVS2B12_02490 [Ktedonobacteraceae bacterium]
MNLLERVLTLLRANLNSVVERADDPEKALRQLQLDMHNQLVQVKTEVAKAIAEGHTLQKRSVTRKAEADSWLRQAEQAVQQGDDNAARAALTHYNDSNKLVKRYQQQKKDQEQLVITLRRALRQLEAKLAEVDTTIDLLVTRKRNALIQQRVIDALNKTGDPRDKDQVARVQDAALEAEARAQAQARLQSMDDATRLDQLIAEQEIEQQLQQIKGIRPRSHTPTHNGEIRRHTTPLSSPRLPHDVPANKRERRPARQIHAPAEPSTDRDLDLDLDYLKKLLDAPQGSDY